MKKIFLFALMAAGLALSSCVNSTLDPLSGDFLPAPTEVVFTKLNNSEAAKDANGRWIFNLDLSDDAGTTLHAVLVGNKYFLGTNTYTEAPDATAKNGNFIAGQTTVNGKPVRQGSITVKQAESKYTISAVLFLEDGSPYKIEWTGKLEYEEPAVLEPEYTYSDAVAQDCTDSNNTPYLDVESHTLTLKDKSGEFAAQIKLVRSVGTTDLSGVYTVAEYAHEDLTAGNGFDMSPYGWPVVIGSYYVKDGANVIVEPGETITVTAMGDGVYSIDGSTGYSFLCAPEGYVPGGGTVYDMTETIAVDCTDPNNTLYEDVESHTFVLKDSAGEFVAQIKLVRSVGTTDMSGTYNVVEYAHEDLTAANGFDMSAYGWPVVIGTYYVQDGANVIVEPGETISVSSIAENTYKFVGSSDWEFTGKLKESETPGPGPVDPGTGGDEVVTLTEFLSLTDYNGYGAKLVGIELGTKGFSYTPADWVTTYSPSYPVDGNFLKLEVYSEDGKIAPGTYKACATGGTVGAGEFGIGYESWGNASGTSWFTVASGAASYTLITDGTVEVSVSGDVYTIELKSTALNAKYVGKLAAGGVESDVVELTEFLSLTDYSGYGVKLVGVELGTKGFYYTPADWVTTYAPTYPVDGNFLKLEVYSEDGKVAAGTYKACATGGTVGAGEFGIGYESWGNASGTSWFTVASGAASYALVTDGTVTVAVEGDVYTIELASTALNAKYVGKLSK